MKTNPASPQHADAAMVADARRALTDPTGGPLSQESMARLLGVSFPTYNAWERGRTAPRKENAELLVLLSRAIATGDARNVRQILEGCNGSRARIFAALQILANATTTV